MNVLHSLHLHSITESDESSGSKTGRLDLSKNAESNMPITAKVKCCSSEHISIVYM